jgi:hypothetical protein
MQRPVSQSENLHMQDLNIAIRRSFKYLSKLDDFLNRLFVVGSGDDEVTLVALPLKTKPIERVFPFLGINSNCTKEFNLRIDKFFKQRVVATRVIPSGRDKNNSGGMHG